MGEMPKTPKHYSELRKLKGEKVLALVPNQIYVSTQGEDEDIRPHVHAKNYLKLNATYPPTVLHVSSSKYGMESYFVGELGLVSLKYAEKNYLLFPSLHKIIKMFGEEAIFKGLEQEQFHTHQTDSISEVPEDSSKGNAVPPIDLNLDQSNYPIYDRISRRKEETQAKPEEFYDIFCSYGPPSFEEIIDAQRRSFVFSDIPIKTFDAEFEWGSLEVKELIGANDIKHILQLCFANIKKDCWKYDPIASRTHEIKGLFNVVKQLGGLVYLAQNIPSHSHEQYSSLFVNKDGIDSVCISISNCNNVDLFIRGLRIGVVLLFRKSLGKDVLGIDVHDEAINLIVSKKRKGKLSNIKDFEKCTLTYSSGLCLELANTLLKNRSIYDTKFEPSKKRMTLIHNASFLLKPINDATYVAKQRVIPDEFILVDENKLKSDESINQSNFLKAYFDAEPSFSNRLRGERSTKRKIYLRRNKELQEIRKNHSASRRPSNKRTESEKLIETITQTAVYEILLPYL